MVGRYKSILISSYPGTLRVMDGEAFREMFRASTSGRGSTIVGFSGVVATEGTRSWRAHSELYSG